MIIINISVCNNVYILKCPLIVMGKELNIADIFYEVFSINHNKDYLIKKDSMAPIEIHTLEIISTSELGSGIVHGDAMYDFLKISFSNKLGILGLYHIEDLSEREPSGHFRLCGIESNEIKLYPNGRFDWKTLLSGRNYCTQDKDLISKRFNKTLDIAINEEKSFADLIKP
jgi:hypothetical protein